jgi:hypothetical protein
MLDRHKLFVILFEVVFDPLQLLFSLGADLRLILFTIADEGVH